MIMDVSFFRFIGALYFSSKISVKEGEEFNNPADLFKHIKVNNSNNTTLEVHLKFLHAVRNNHKATSKGGEEQDMPYHTALNLHWKRTVLISEYYEQSLKNHMSLPNCTMFGYKVESNIMSPVWDIDDHIKHVNDTVKYYIKGCACKSNCQTRHCGCKKSGKSCTPGCSCTNCTNMSTKDTTIQEEIRQIDVENDDTDETEIPYDIDKNDVTECDD